MRIFRAISDLMERGIKMSGLLALVLMVCLIFFNILSRFLFQVTFGVAEEWPVWLMIWSVFIFIGINIKENAHLSVDIIQNKLGEKQQRIFNVFSSIVMIVFGVLFLAACWSDVVLTKMILVRTITSIPVPLWIVKICLPLGMIFFIFHAVEKLVGDIQILLKEGKSC